VFSGARDEFGIQGRSGRREAARNFFGNSGEGMFVTRPTTSILLNRRFAFLNCNHKESLDRVGNFGEMGNVHVHCSENSSRGLCLCVFKVIDVKATSFEQLIYGSRANHHQLA
jgi:hypothetical protein